MVSPSTSLTSASANVIFLSIQDILLGTNIIPSLPSSSRSSFDTIPKEGEMPRPNRSVVDRCKHKATDEYGRKKRKRGSKNKESKCDRAPS